MHEYLFCNGDYAVQVEKNYEGKLVFSLHHQVMGGEYREDCNFWQEEVLELIHALQMAVRENSSYDFYLKVMIPRQQP